MEKSGIVHEKKTPSPDTAAWQSVSQSVSQPVKGSSHNLHWVIGSQTAAVNKLKIVHKLITIDSYVPHLLLLLLLLLPLLID